MSNAVEVYPPIHLPSERSSPSERAIPLRELLGERRGEWDDAWRWAVQLWCISPATGHCMYLGRRQWVCWVCSGRRVSVADVLDVHRA